MSEAVDPTILLLGATGQVGHELRRSLEPIGTLQAPGRDTVDLTAPESVRTAVREMDPDVVVNAAAYTAVDEAEEDPDAAAEINAHAPGVLAEAARSVDAWIVHYSTDYVFDGEKTTPYNEDDPPNPLNVYGRTKWDGEKAVENVGGQYLILRSSWIYSARRSNFLLTMLRLAETKDHLKVVDDQIGTPTCAEWIADATTSLLRRVLERETSDALSGLYHVSAGGQTSWYGFARAIFARFGHEELTVEPVTSDEFPTTAVRPRYSALASTRVQSAFDLEIPTWTEQLAAVQKQMEQESATEEEG